MPFLSNKLLTNKQTMNDSSETVFSWFTCTPFSKFDTLLIYHRAAKQSPINLFAGGPTLVDTTSPTRCLCRSGSERLSERGPGPWSVRQSGLHGPRVTEGSTARPAGRHVEPVSASLAETWYSNEYALRAVKLNVKYTFFS